MTLRISGAAAALAFALSTGSLAAAPLPVGAVPEAAPLVTQASAYNSRGFKRCMRAKYGPRYFSRVNRAHRWHMSQACLD
jgi:hypothetical protein